MHRFLRIIISLALLTLLPSICLADDPAQTIGNGIMAFYALDGSPYDASGNGLDGQDIPQVQYINGQFGLAARFQPAAGSVVLDPRIFLSKMNADYSISTWIYINSVNVTSFSSMIPIVGQLRLCSRTDDGIPALTLAFSDDRETTTGNFQNALYLSTTPLTAGVWFHVGMTFRAADRSARLFINGTDVTSSQPRLRNMHSAEGSQITNPLPFGFGSEGTFDLTLDEIMVHSRVLSMAEMNFLASRIAETRARSPRSGSCGGYNQAPCESCLDRWWWRAFYGGACPDVKQSCSAELIPKRGGICGCGVGLWDGSSCNRDILPTMEVEKLPAVLRLGQGYKATIYNADNARYTVPNSQKTPVSCHRLVRYRNLVCAPDSGRSTAYCEAMKAKAAMCQTHPPAPASCGPIGVREANDTPQQLPTFTLDEWQSIYPVQKQGIKINANWYNIQGVNGYPHLVPCSNANGYVRSKGVTISPANKADVMGSDSNYMDAFLVIDTPMPDGSVHRTLQIAACQGNCQNITNTANVTYAVGGFILAENGRVRTSFPSSVKANNTGARTGIGLDANGKTLYVVVVQNGQGAAGANARQLANELLAMGAKSVINLDNSGSSQFLYSDGITEQKTDPGDNDAIGGTRVYRPVPVFLGIDIDNRASHAQRP